MEYVRKNAPADFRGSAQRKSAEFCLICGKTIYPVDEALEARFFKPDWRHLEDGYKRAPADNRGSAQRLSAEFCVICGKTIYTVAEVLEARYLKLISRSYKSNLRF